MEAIGLSIKNDLQGQLLGMPWFDDEHKEYHPHVDDLASAEGVVFLCPQCFAANEGPKNTHGVICWGPRVGSEFHPGPGRWELLGSGLHDLSLGGAHGRSDSVQLLGEKGCRAHFFVTEGCISNNSYKQKGTTVLS